MLFCRELESRVGSPFNHTLWFLKNIKFKCTSLSAAPCCNTAVTDVHPHMASIFFLRLVLSLCGFHIAMENLQKIRNSSEVCVWRISLAKLNFQTKIKSEEAVVTHLVVEWPSFCAGSCSALSYLSLPCFACCSCLSAATSCYINEYVVSWFQEENFLWRKMLEHQSQITAHFSFINLKTEITFLLYFLSV